MTYIRPAFDGSELAAAAPSVSRRIVDDFEAWIDEVTPYYVAEADTGVPFTIDAVARRHNLPDPPKPQSQWGGLPIRLQKEGIIRHHDYGGSVRAHQSLVHVWIGVPVAMREMVAARRREERAARRAARNEQRKAA
jgi:hypothetical protein